MGRSSNPNAERLNRTLFSCNRVKTGYSLLTSFKSAAQVALVKFEFGNLIAWNLSESVELNYWEFTIIWLEPCARNVKKIYSTIIEGGCRCPRNWNCDRLPKKSGSPLFLCMQVVLSCVHRFLVFWFSKLSKESSPENLWSLFEWAGRILNCVIRNDLFQMRNSVALMIRAMTSR